ncbi:hypothetical protein G6F36_010862 [Rhizopus arrhizus]|nr:hypothetical protein G6F36_010862 [Rhizopus arrhizus]
MYQDRHLDPEATANLLKVNGLPDYFDDNKLYDIFRPFGPLNLCKCVMIDGSFKGTAFIQFFHQTSSDEAQNNLNGRLFEGYKLSVTIYMPSNYNTTQQHQEKAMEDDNNNSVVDMMNLYIKNLDPNITNADLNHLFRKFGRIVSARVMTNAATGQSKGYGFVSFGKSEEAAAALKEMNGYIVNDRPLIVAYHEPKKGKTNNQPQHQQRQYRPNSVYQQSTYLEQPQSYRSSVNGLGINHVDEIGMNSNIKDLSVGQKPMYRKPSEQYSLMTANTTKSLASLASGASIQPMPSSYVKIPQKRPTLRRKGSLESVMTESSANVQRIKLEAAVNECGDYGKLANEIVDMLLTLKRKERSLCLFNRDFLKEKINSALEALAACEESEESEEEIESIPQNPPAIYQNQRQNRISTIPVYNTTYQHINTISQPKSKAIPIVAPPSASPASSSALNQNTANKDTSEDIKSLIDSFEGKPIHEKKQLLGDKLFPLVKATGTKQAPKVTIRLLDTVDLYELAKIMFDTLLLKARVEEAFNSL